MSNTTNIKFFGLASLILAVLLLTVTPTWSGQKRTGSSSQYFADNGGSYSQAMKKTGYYYGIVNGFVKLEEDKTWRKLSYLASEEIIFTYEGQDVDPLRLWPAGFVELIIVDAEVVEVILLLEAS